MRIGQIGLTQVTARVGGNALVAAAARVGLSGIEPMISEAGSEYLAWTDGQVADFADQAARLGVQVPSVALGAFNEDDALVNAAGQRRATELITRSLQFCHAAGASTMLLCTFFKSHPDTPDKKARLARVLQDVTPKASELGVTIALETPLDASDLMELIREAGQGNIRVYYDMGNSLWLRHDVPHDIQVLGPLIQAMHVKDTQNVLGDSHLGKGRLDLQAAIASLNRVGYRGWLMLETPSGDEQALREDIQILKKCLGTR